MAYKLHNLIKRSMATILRTILDDAGKEVVKILEQYPAENTRFFRPSLAFDYEGSFPFMPLDMGAITQRFSCAMEFTLFARQSFERDEVLDIIAEGLVESIAVNDYSQTTPIKIGFMKAELPLDVTPERIETETGQQDWRGVIFARFNYDKIN